MFLRSTITANKFPWFSLKLKKTRRVPSNLLYIFPIIATPRRPLTSISGNSTAKKALSPYKRGLVNSMFEGGAKKAAIARYYYLPYSTIKDTIDLAYIRDNGASQYKSGWPLFYSLIQERRVLRYIRVNPKAIYKETIRVCLLECSKSIVKKILKKYGIKN